ncbi:MAG: DUF5906 domain-containing protein [Thauera sp.]
MASAVVVHGKQGTGKSKLFKAVGAIYGNYALTINQSAIESTRNTWLASRLYILAEEVIARKELHHVKNALKDLITGDTVYVDPKFVNPYPERNHVNLVFLSNEVQPVQLEDDDRRHLVIWTPDALSEDFYLDVQREIDSGGVAALHHYLLTLPLDGFHVHSKPPMTKSKLDLISLGLDSTVRFWLTLIRGDIEGIQPGIVVLSQDLYKLYTSWSASIGVHAAPMPRLLHILEKKYGLKIARKRWSDGYKTYGPHGVCMIPVQHPGKNGNTRNVYPEKPADMSEPMWIGNHIDAFRNALRDRNGAAHA